MRQTFDVIRSTLVRTWEQILNYLQALNPRQEWVIWIQLLAGMTTVIWIIIQFAAWRRLNEARVERYLEDRIDSEREDLARERQQTLARLDGVIKRRGLKRIVLLAWAHLVLTMSFVLRILSLDTVKSKGCRTTRNFSCRLAVPGARAASISTLLRSA